MSGIGAENPPDGDDVCIAYLRAKAEADAAVIASERDWTVVRPARLTGEPATGRVRIDSAPLSGEIPRADLAALLAAVLGSPRAGRRILYVNGGDEPIDKALAPALTMTS